MLMSIVRSAERSKSPQHVVRPNERCIAVGRSTPRRAFVVHVCNWDARKAELVDHGLIHRGFAIDRVVERRLDEIVGDHWIESVRVMVRNIRRDTDWTGTDGDTSLAWA